MTKQEKSILRKLIHNVDDAHKAVVDYKNNINAEWYSNNSYAGKEYRRKFDDDVYHLALVTCKMEHRVVEKLREMIG